MIYTIDFDRLALQLLPTFYRQPLIFGLLRAALASVKAVYNSFVSARKGHVYRLTHNGQVCYLRAVLNDAFKSPYGKIELLNVERDGDWLYAVTEDGEHITLAAPEDTTDTAGNYVDDGVAVPVLANAEALNAEQNNFVVLVPADLYQTNLIDIAALVDKYKLVSKRAIYMQKS